MYPSNSKRNVHQSQEAGFSWFEYDTTEEGRKEWGNSLPQDTKEENNVFR